MTGPELADLFAAFTQEDWDAFRCRLEEVCLLHGALRGQDAFDRFWMDVEQVVRDLALRRLERQGAELLRDTYMI